jgi:predicted nucleotidyltransferase
VNELLVERAVQYLRSRPEVELAYLFGSQASGRTTALSDVDIAVCPSGDGLPIYRSLLAGLSRCLEGEEMDLILLTDAPPTFAHQVITNGRLIFCRDPHERVAFESQVIREYMDFGSLKAQQQAFLRRRILEGQMGEHTKDWRLSRVL